jgi:hypothetical protein
MANLDDYKSSLEGLVPSPSEKDAREFVAHSKAKRGVVWEADAEKAFVESYRVKTLEEKKEEEERKRSQARGSSDAAVRKRERHTKEIRRLNRMIEERDEPQPGRVATGEEISGAGELLSDVTEAIDEAASIRERYDYNYGHEMYASPEDIASALEDLLSAERALSGSSSYGRASGRSRAADLREIGRHEASLKQQYRRRTGESWVRSSGN